MGFRQIEVTPTNITATTPAGHDVLCKMFQIARTDTTSSIKMELPVDSTIVGIDIYGPASDAATTAVVSVGTTTSSNEIISGQDVKTAGGKINVTSAWQSATYPNIIGVPLSGVDLNIYGKYAETGTASTTGGPYKVVIMYV